MSTSMTDAQSELAQIQADVSAIAKKVNTGFNAGPAAALAVAAAFSFILALALNTFFTLLFAKIPTGGGLLGAAIYAIIALLVCVTMLFLIYVYVEPWLHKRFERN